MGFRAAPCFCAQRLSIRTALLYLLFACLGSIRSSACRQQQKLNNFRKNNRIHLPLFLYCFCHPRSIFSTSFILFHFLACQPLNPPTRVSTHYDITIPRHLSDYTKEPFPLCFFSPKQYPLLESAVSGILARSAPNSLASCPRLLCVCLIPSTRLDKSLAFNTRANDRADFERHLQTTLSSPNPKQNQSAGHIIGRIRSTPDLPPAGLNQRDHSH